MRNVEGYGSNDGCVADGWSKVRHLSVSSLFYFIFFVSAIVDFAGGGKAHLNGRIPGGLRRDESREKCG